jgi:hypothetical protein
MLVLVDPVPQCDDGKTQPHNSYRASMMVVASASMTRPTAGKLWLLGGTYAEEFDVYSLALSSGEPAQQNVEIRARNARREVTLSLQGEPSTDYEHIRQNARRLCRRHHLPAPILGGESQDHTPPAPDPAPTEEGSG